MATRIVTDDRSRAVQPGGSHQEYLVEDYEDGSMFLEPAVTVSRDPLAYNTDADLRTLLGEAATSQTVTKSRRRRDR